MMLIDGRYGSCGFEPAILDEIEMVATIPNVQVVVKSNHYEVKMRIKVSC